MSIFSSVSQSVSAFLATDPSVLAVQMLMILAVFLVVFLVLFTTRDIISRTHSFIFQVFCILLVAVLPIVGFLTYLLIRPRETLSQRALRRSVHELLSRVGKRSEPKQQKSSKSQ